MDVLDFGVELSFFHVIIAQQVFVNGHDLLLTDGVLPVEALVLEVELSLRVVCND